MMIQLDLFWNSMNERFQRATRWRPITSGAKREREVASEAILRDSDIDSIVETVVSGELGMWGEPFDVAPAPPEIDAMPACQGVFQATQESFDDDPTEEESLKELRRLDVDIGSDQGQPDHMDESDGALPPSSDSQ
jgi:hypothetical protein